MLLDDERYVVVISLYWPQKVGHKIGGAVQNLFSLFILEYIKFYNKIKFGII